MSKSTLSVRGEKLPKTVSEAVIAAVADTKGVDELALDRPLYEAINPEALDNLFRNSSGTVQFDYLGYTVTVDQDGSVTVAEAVDA